MRKVKDIKEYIWIIVLIGGILTLISFFTPAFYVDLFQVEEYFWMWGLHYGSIAGYASDFAFIPLEEPSRYMMPIFFAGLFPALLILLSSIMLIVIANGMRNGKRDLKYYGNRSIGWGITLILASIIFIISISITMNEFIEYLFYDPYNGFTIDIWDVYNPGYAVIGPFLGAILAIIGGIASKYITSREGIIMPEKEKIFISKISTKPLTVQFRYCPECGQKLLYAKSRFCAQCGFEFIT